MDVPVDAGSVVEFRVDRGEGIGAEDWGDERLYRLVEDEGEEDFVDVIGKRRQRDRVCERFDKVEEQRRRGWYWVEHYSFGLVPGSSSSRSLVSRSMSCSCLLSPMLRTSKRDSGSLFNAPAAAAMVLSKRAQARKLRP